MTPTPTTPIWNHRPSISSNGGILCGEVFVCNFIHLSITQHILIIYSMFYLLACPTYSICNGTKINIYYGTQYTHIILYFISRLPPCVGILWTSYRPIVVFVQYNKYHKIVYHNSLNYDKGIRSPKHTRLMTYIHMPGILINSRDITTKKMWSYHQDKWYK